MDMDYIFGKEGLLAANVDGYEAREGQVKMANGVAEALNNKKHLVVEAGTGTGKSFGYLIPAIEWAVKYGKRVIVSTATKNLQEQLAEKDIPFLQSILPYKFIAVVAKGRSNYACIHKITHSQDQAFLDGMDEIDDFKKIQSWLSYTRTGDKAELKDFNENFALWNKINAKAETCTGQKCPDFISCFVTQNKARAETAQIIIVNHHLFFADLAIREKGFAKVLPNYDAVIFDEAHKIEDIATDYFGFKTSSYAIDELIRDIGRMPNLNQEQSAYLSKLCSAVQAGAEPFWSGIDKIFKKEGKYALDRTLFCGEAQGGLFNTPATIELDALTDALSSLGKGMSAFKLSHDETENLMGRIYETKKIISMTTSQVDMNYAYWIEKKTRTTILGASPIDVAELLANLLFDKPSPCILTSATLSSSGNFDFVSARLGIPKGDRTLNIHAASPFDYRKQAVLYLPKLMPDPKDPKFIKAASNEIVELLEASKGRAFVLCTSYWNMNQFYDLVSARVNFPCMKQGVLQKSVLLQKFRDTPNSVLFATSSFWEGVDVRGESLSCVIIDKTPFAVPTDPIIKARMDFIDGHGGNAFFDYSIPQAIILLKQGVGRLIRSKTDKGIIALLDPRITGKPYGKAILVSMPPAQVMRTVREAGKIFD